MAVEGDTDSNQAQAQAGDTAEFAALTGRYHGQIDARIERAWRRPRSPVEEGKRSVTPGLNDAVKDESSVAQFSCAVRIIQDPRGNVSEVQLLACNGSTAWKQSLISAILTASPLPAPPDPKVFSSGVTLVFTARQYTSDESTDAYEPAVQSAMRP
jgi:hypothetical protein